MKVRSALVASLMILALRTMGAAAGTSVLFIGNSFLFGSGSAVRFYRADTVTDLNNEGIGGVPALFKSFAQQAGLDYDVSLETRGGVGLDFHLENKLEVIGRRGWDVVVMHGYSTLDADKPRDPAKLIATSKQMADFLRARNPKVQLYLMATWSRADETYPAKGAWAGQPIEAMARDVRAAYDKAAGRGRSQGRDPGRRSVDTRDPDRRRRSESLRRHRRGQAQSLDLRQLSRQHARLLPRGAGDLRQRDRPRSALARRERVLGLRAGTVARSEAKALQQVAFDQLAGTGTVTAAPLVLPKAVNPERCVAAR